MNLHRQETVTPDNRRIYMEIKTRLERDSNVNSNLKDIIQRYENIRPRSAERISNITELILELEQRCIIRYINGVNKFTILT